MMDWSSFVAFNNACLVLGIEKSNLFVETPVIDGYLSITISENLSV